MFRLIGKTYPNFKLGMRFIFSLGPRELDYLREDFSASHRVPQGSPGWHKGQKVGFSTDLTLAATTDLTLAAT